MHNPLLAADVREATREWLRGALELLPPWARDTWFLGLFTWQWLGLLALCAGALLLGKLLAWLAVAATRRVAAKAPGAWGQGLVNASPGPLRWGITAVLAYLFLPLLALPPPAHSALGLLLRTALIVIGAWVVLRLTDLAAAVLEAILARQTANASLQRSIHTQIAVPLRAFRFLVVLLAIALVLVQFEAVRTVGISLLASAGVAGVVVGLAAQRTVANLLAGIQIAVFQPIRIGDWVVVEGEQGRVEEIGLTYVMIRLWDERRLILPVSYFLEKPFQNWTRRSPELLGAVLLPASYAVQVEEVRAELRRVLEATELWDRRAQVVEVTELKERGVELRLLVSAADGERLWQLRCHVREQLLAWLQAEGKGYLQG
jgi:small-conductance mechanosensitive channel